MVWFNSNAWFRITSSSCVNEKYAKLKFKDTSLELEIKFANAVIVSHFLFLKEIVIVFLFENVE